MYPFAARNTGVCGAVRDLGLTSKCANVIIEAVMQRFSAILLVGIAAMLIYVALTRDLGPLEYGPTGTIIALLLIGAFRLSRSASRAA